MPRTSHQLGPPDYALLGLLALAPRHGYELAPNFAANGELGLVCTMGVSRLYAVLHLLEELGYVRCERSELSGGPPRKVFHLTAAGNAVFERWLNEPVRRLRQIRQDFLLKLYFSERLADHDTGTLLERQLAVCRELLAELGAAERAATAGSFEALVLSSRRATAVATLSWLDERQTEAVQAG